VIDDHFVRECCHRGVLRRFDGELCHLDFSQIVLSRILKKLLIVIGKGRGLRLDVRKCRKRYSGQE
jgi:hypothetical protein